MKTSCGERQVHNTKCKTSDTGKNVLMKTDNCEHIQNTKGSGRIWYNWSWTIGPNITD